MTVADWRELLDRADVDAVALCSPSALHADQVVAFAEAGKHVFCEKPLATDLASADRALAAADAAGIVLQVGYNRRFDRSYAAVRAAVADGRVGPAADRARHRPRPGAAAAVPTSTGRGPETIFVDTTSHDLDLVRFVTGEDIAEVSARGSVLLDTGAPGMVDTAVTTVLTESGTLATIDNTWRSAYGYDQRLEVHGTEGTALAGNERVDATTFADGAGLHAPPPPYFFLDRYAQSFVAELESFAAALDGAPVAVTGRDGRAALAAAQAAALSAAESRIVRLDELG